MPRTDKKIEYGKFVKPIYYKNLEKISCGADEDRKKSGTFKKVPFPPPPPPPNHKNQMVRS